MVADYICQGALNLWGEDAQLDMIIEEMAELTKALLKYKRAAQEDKPFFINFVAEEQADVEIMLAQLYFIMCKNTGQKYHGKKIQFRDEKISRLTSLLDQAETKRCMELRK
jgi:hypothetical protein